MANSKKTVLDALKRNRLLEVADAAGLELPERRSVEVISGAMSRSRSLTLEKVLDYLTLDELKGAAHALGIDGGGRSKDDVRRRILEASGGAPAGKGVPEVASASDASGAEAEPAPGGELTLQQLEAHLWGSADILRGSIDAADFKTFIFGLLFLKRISDVFEEEAEQLVTNGAQLKLAWEDPDEHRFFVPPKARWSALQKLTGDVGRAIDNAAHELEAANPELEGVFGGVSYNDKEKLPDETLVSLIRHFSKFRLRNGDLIDPDILGRAYEYLIAQFASSAGKKGGEFYTPKEVVRLLVEILRPAEGMRVYDPCCGSGGMLIQAARYLADHGKDPKKLSLVGQEKNVGTWAIAKMNLFLHDLGDADVQKGDTLRSPKHTEGGTLKVFDRVIANPPFSLKNWGEKECAADSFGRFRFGLPPASYGDLAFVQHMLASCNAKGMVGTVMPHGILYRARSDERIRRGLVEADVIEAIIGLAPNLFHGAGLPTCLFILNRAKPSGRKGRILLVDGSRLCRHEVNQDVLDDEHVAALVAAYHSYGDVPGFSRVVSIDDVRAHDFNLNLARYLDSTGQAAEQDVGVELAQLGREESSRDELASEWRASVAAFSRVSHDDWHQIRLEEAFTQVIDRGHTADLPVLAVTIGEGVVHRDSLDRKMDREVQRGEYLRVRPGDIVYNTMRMWQGASGLAREEGYVSPAYTVCRPEPGEVPEFWAYYFKLPGMIQRFRNYSQGVAEDRYRLYFTEFAKVPALRPSPDMQRKISAVLSETTQVLAAQRRVVAQMQRVNDALLSGLLAPQPSRRPARAEV